MKTTYRVNFTSFSEGHVDVEAGSGDEAINKFNKNKSLIIEWNKEEIEIQNVELND